MKRVWELKWMPRSDMALRRAFEIGVWAAQVNGVEYRVNREVWLQVTGKI